MLFVGAHELEPFLFVVREKVIAQNALSHLPHQPMIERQIVNSQEMPAENFVGFDEMVQVGARVVAAGLAIALGVERLFGEFMHGAAQLKFPVRGERHAALRQLRRDDAVEHVDAAMDGSPAGRSACPRP